MSARKLLAFTSMLAALAAVPSYGSEASDLHWQNYQQAACLASRSAQLKATEYILTNHLQQINSQAHPDDRLVIACLEKLSTVCSKEQHWQQAQQYAELAVRFCQRSQQPTRAAELRNALAAIYLRQNKFTQAELNFSRNVDFHNNSEPNPARLRALKAEALFGLAEVQLAQRKLDESGSYFAKAFATLTAEDSLGTSHLVKYAKYLLDKGQLQPAEHELLIVLDTDSQLFGKQDPALSSTLNDLALVCFRQKKISAAECYMEQAVAIARHWQYADLPDWLDNLSQILTAADKKDQAAGLRAEAESLRKQPPKTAAAALPR